MVTSLTKWSLPCLVAGMMMPVLPAVAEDGEGIVRMRKQTQSEEGVVRISDAPQTVLRGQSPPARLPEIVTQTAYNNSISPNTANIQSAMQEDAAQATATAQVATASPAPALSCAPLDQCSPDFAAVSAAGGGHHGSAGQYGNGGIFGNGGLFGNGSLFNKGASGHGSAGHARVGGSDSIYGDQFASGSQYADHSEYGGEDLPLGLGFTTALRNDIAYHGAWIRGKTGIADGYGPDGEPLNYGNGERGGNGLLASGGRRTRGGHGQSGRIRLGRDPLMGKYQIVYPVDPGYFDARDGQVYAAQGYGGPVSVPLAPVVNHTYNYGWGVPSSRLTPVQHPVRQAPPATVPGYYPSAPVSY